MDIKKIIREEFELFNNKLGIETPFTWLVDNFGNLTERHKDDGVYYVDSEEKPIIYHNRDFYVDINYERVWEVLEEIFELDYSEIQGIILEWLRDVYNLDGFEPTWVLDSNLLEQYLY